MKLTLSKIGIESGRSQPTASGSKSKWLAFILVAQAALLSLPAFAQVEVVEGEPAVVTEGNYPSSRVYTSTPANNSSSSNNTVNGGGYSGSDSGSGVATLFVELQALQAEIRELRGLVEQQGYTIQQLSQRRMDDYLDLDRRIGELSGVTSAASNPSSTNMPSNNSQANNGSTNTSYTTAGSSVAPRPAAPAAVPKNASEADVAKQAYRAAYQKVKDRQFDDARVSLVAFIDGYPDSHYVPNAYFWLGELYYLESDLEQSQQSFTALITAYPQHRKVADAKFKLGKVYHQMGDQNTARSMLESVINDHPGSTAANPAREYLNNSLR
jgi:tol-pal system protein YbgF